MIIEHDFDYRLRPEEFKIIYGFEDPEEISERLRLESGTALAKAEGIADAEATLIKKSVEYPLFGYLYDHQGWWDGRILIRSETELERFMTDYIKQETREVKITNGVDELVFHSENGKVVWPSEGS